MSDPVPGIDELPSLLNESRIAPVHVPLTLFDHRNIEDIHNDALAAAQVAHKKVRDSALRVFRLNELRQAQIRLRQQTLQEEERVRIETLRAQDEIRLRELQAKLIPKPPTPKNTLPPAVSSAPPPPPPLPSTPAPAAIKKENIAATPATGPSPAELSVEHPLIQEPINPQPTAQPSTRPPASQTKPSQAPHTQSATASQPPQALQQNQERPVTTNSSEDRLPPHVFPSVDRYLQIHHSLKQLRSHMAKQAAQNPALKKRMGEMRRGIRMSVGQLTEGKGVNKQPTTKILDTLKEALAAASPPMDPSIVIVSKPEPTEGAANNGDTLPILFIYLLNVFSKAIISQFIDEAGVAPKAADPIGVVAVSIFSNPAICWRGKSLIDILMAKMRVVCPVLFGIRGSEKTEEGRARLGWRKSEDGAWVIDQVHNTRMTGLGAGYAAVSLRDFSKSSKLQNPYPPVNYWMTVASILSTPPEQASSTQYMVLKALLENYEQRFMSFYGHAARAVLQVALVDFPARALENSVALSSLKVLADKLRKDVGLQLQH